VCVCVCVCHPSTSMIRRVWGCTRLFSSLSLLRRLSSFMSLGSGASPDAQTHTPVSALLQWTKCGVKPIQLRWMWTGRRRTGARTLFGEWVSEWVSARAREREFVCVCEWVRRTHTPDSVLDASLNLQLCVYLVIGLFALILQDSLMIIYISVSLHWDKIWSVHHGNMFSPYFNSSK